MAGVAALEDAGLLIGDLLERVAEKLGVVDRDAGDDGGERMIDHIGRVQPAAEADFQQQHIGRMAREQQQADRGGDLEHGDGRAGIGALAFLQRRAELLVGHQHAFARLAQAEALVEAHQMRRGIDVHALAGRFQDRAQEGDGGALAVGAGDMDHRRQLALGMIERGEQPLDAIERQIDALGMQRGQPRDDRVNRRRHGGALTRAPEPAIAAAHPSRRRLGQQPAQFGERRAQLVAVHDHVHHAVLG